MKPFPTAILIIFALFIIAGVVAVASFGKFNSGGSDGVPAQAVIWGTLDQSLVNSTINLFNQENKNILEVSYQQFSESSFDSELTEALAENRGPDAVLISSERLLKHQKKIYPIPFESISERFFRDTFTEGSEIYLSNAGIQAFPISIDPMVLYWNRTLFNAAGIAQAPQTWEGILSLVPQLSRVDARRTIEQSTIALGEHRNILHAKEILVSMLIQAGNPLTIRVGDRIDSIFNEQLTFPEAPADSALRFYTEFANPVKPSYSWNRSLPVSRDMFARENLALYLGFGSEVFTIREQNPNLNFDITRMPQVREPVEKATFGRIYGLALLNQSPRKANALQALMLLTGKDIATLWSEAFGLPPARRDLLSVVPTDPYKAVLYRDALIARGFLDPDPEATDTIFASLIEGVTSGRVSISQAVTEADGRLDALFEE